MKRKACVWVIEEKHDDGLWYARQAIFRARALARYWAGTLRRDFHTVRVVKYVRAGA